ncbi:MAG TPA: hypothetical protein VMR65_05155 [Candidatus Sulfotelmatobacter sp.]|jgi:hypothetical protein|nr:hypothetical protein [Candidatus Sulfotelmatobacter sp.]
MGETARGEGNARPGFRELASSALRYWEPRRLIYNLVLLAVVCAHLYAGWPNSKGLITPDGVFTLFILAVLANVAYCAAYVVDLFVQFSGMRGEWARWRWIVLVVGCAFGAALAHFFTQGLLLDHGGP